MKPLIAVVTPPFSGHFNSLFMFVRQIQQSLPMYSMKWICTGWSGISLSDFQREQMNQSENDFVECLASALQQPDPFYFTFSRAREVLEEVKMHCVGASFIIYDFFSVEGYLVGKMLNIPSIAFLSALLADVDLSMPLFTHALQDNAEDITYLEDQCRTPIFSKLLMLGDGFFLPSDFMNITFTYPSFFAASHAQIQKHIPNLQIVSPRFIPLISNSDQRWVDEFKSSYCRGKKLIYISFGTILLQYLYDKIPLLMEFINKCFQLFIAVFAHHPAYEIIISSGRETNDFLPNIPGNFHIFKQVPQKALLNEVDLFITHGGHSSVLEAIDHAVPMLVIPFFGDQHQIAANVQSLNLGIAYEHDAVTCQKALSAASNVYDRLSLPREEKFAQDIDALLHSHLYRENIQNLKFMSQLESMEQSLLQDVFLLNNYNYLMEETETKDGDELMEC